MGVDTKGYLRKDITATDIFNVIYTKFDENAKLDVRTDSDGEIGNICFKFNDEHRQMFYCVSTRDSQDERGLFDSASKYVCLILGCWGNSAHIMSEVVKEFGGYIDENDCDGIDAVYIDKSGDFQYSEYVAERNRLVEVFDADLSKSMKYQIAGQIMKHREKIKAML